MRNILGFLAVVMVAAACGGGSGVDLEGGSVFVGEFTSEPGLGPGSIRIELDADGTMIPSLSIDPALVEYLCPAGASEGVRLTGGGYTLTITPGIPIEGDSFTNEHFSGTFTSATEVSGTYDLVEDYKCEHVVSWSATQE